jgi:plasmid stability protein
MPNVLIRDVPDDVHAELQRRAEAAGQSLQQYLTHELKRLAERPTMDEVLDRIERYNEGELGFDVAVSYIEEGRTQS